MGLGPVAPLSAPAAGGQRGCGRHLFGRRQYPTASRGSRAAAPAAPLSKSAVSRIVGTLKVELEAWRTRSLAELTSSASTSMPCAAGPERREGRGRPALGIVAVLTDGQKQLVALELCAGGETFEAWKGCLDDLGARGLVAPVWCVIDGHPGLRKAVGLGWPAAVVQRCCVHKLRNLERKAPKHALAEIRADFHRIVYAESAAAARAAYTAFERKWTPRCPGVVRSLQEGGDELLTFFQFPKRQWKTLRTTNVIERLNEEFRRRVKTQGALPTEDAALVLLFGLVVSGQIRLRRLDGWRQIPPMLRAPPVGRMTHRAAPPGSRSIGRPLSAYPPERPFRAIRIRAMLPHHPRTGRCAPHFPHQAGHHPFKGPVVNGIDGRGDLGSTNRARCSDSAPRRVRWWLQCEHRHHRDAGWRRSSQAEAVRKVLARKVGGETLAGTPTTFFCT